MKYFPDPTTPIKGEEYYRQAAECFWDWRMRKLTTFPEDKINRIKENRAYAKGEQSVDRYVHYYQSEGDSTSKGHPEGTTKEDLREGWANMDFKNIPTIAPKIVSALHGQFDDIDYVTSMKSTDPKSGEERLKIKWLDWLRTEHGQWLEKIAAMGDAEIERPTFAPDSIAELHLHDAAGGYKIPLENELEKAISHSFDISNWDEVKKEALDDFIADNHAVIKTTTCPNTGKRKGEYVDIDSFDIQYSKHYDHRDSEMAGHWKEVTVGELGRYFDRDDLRKIAKQSAGMNGNPVEFSQYDQKDSMGRWKYDFYKVIVFHFSFIDYDNDYKITYHTPFGRKIDTYNAKWDYEPKRGETKTVTSIRKLKKVSWIVGTKFVYDWGEDFDMVRPDEKDVMLPYACIRLPGKSIIDSAKVYLDDIVHIHFKTMNALITAAGSGFALDVGALEGLTLGGKPVSEMTVLDIYRNQNILFFKRTDDYSQPTGGGQYPIFEIPGGIGRFLQEQMELFAHTMRMLETITGINPVTLGDTPAERQPVRHVQMSIQGTQNVLRPMINGLKTLKKKMAENFALSIPYVIQMYEIAEHSYREVIGRPGIELLRMMRGNIYSMGIKLEPMLTAQHQEQLLRMVELAMQKDQHGQAGLNIGEAMLIQERIILGSPLKQVRLEVSNLIRKAQDRINLQAENLHRVQGEERRADEQQRHQQKLQMVDIETQAKADLQEREFRNRIKEMKAESNLNYITQLLEQWKEEETN